MRGLAEIVRLRTGDCRDAVDVIAQIAAGDEDVDELRAGHVGQCLRCQAEVAAYRRILRAMRSMRYDSVPPPAGGMAAVVAALESAHGAGPSTRAARAVYFGGITVATAAAGAAGVLVWMSRRRVGLADAG
jgi:hypothetical protein